MGNSHVLRGRQRECATSGGRRAWEAQYAAKLAVDVIVERGAGVCAQRLDVNRVVSGNLLQQRICGGNDPHRCKL